MSASEQYGRAANPLVAYTRQIVGGVTTHPLDTDFTIAPRQIWIQETGGVLVWRGEDGNDVTTAVQAYERLTMSPTSVRTGTTCTWQPVW